MFQIQKLLLLQRPTNKPIQKSSQFIYRCYYNNLAFGTTSSIFNNSASKGSSLFSSLRNEILEDDDCEEEEISNIQIQRTSNNSSNVNLSTNRLDRLREQLSTDQYLNLSDLSKPSSSSTATNTNSKVNDDDNYEIPKSVQKILTKLRAQKQQQQQEEQSSDNTAMLTDTFKRVHNYLRISLIERCNLRCQYCMPPEGTTLQPSENLLSTPELQRLVHLFVQSGVNKVRLTGGEPLLRKDLSSIIAHINSFDRVNSIGITTNGITLSRQLPALAEAGLTHVNISLDTLHESRFVEITRRKGYNKVIQSIKDSMIILQPNNERRVKVNCVVMRNVNDDEIINFCSLLEDDNEQQKPLDIRFIEWMPFYNNKWNADRLVTYKQMLSKIESHYGAPLIKLQDLPNDTTKWYALPTSINNNNPLRRIGFITSMSEHFCGTCNRLRITADGQLKVCLFGSQEINLRSILRQHDLYKDDDLKLIIEAAVKSKHFSLGGHASGEEIARKNENRAMTLIGG